MPEYTYEAMASTGARSTGQVTANSEREVVAVLDSKGLFPIKIAPVKPKGLSGWGSGRVSRTQIATFYSQLADLLRNGVPLLRSLDTLERQTSSQVLASTVREVRARVADGTGLAQAMGSYPKVFDELAVSMIRAGQEGGFLEDVLVRIADFTEHEEDLKSKVTGAMAYPVFLAIIGVVVLNILVIFFVPKFEPIFKRLKEKGELPDLTVWLIAMSHFMQSYWYVAIILVVLFVWGVRRYMASDSGRLIIDGLKLRIPVAGTIFLNLAIARFARILGTLLRNGIPILQAMRIAKDSTGNRVLADAIDKSAENIKAGEKLARPLRACKYFPTDVVEIIAVGEESNSLEKVLLDIANGLEKRTNRQLDIFVRLLEPVMLLVMAMMVLVVVIGLLLPVFKMSSSLG
jgi:general secretion pathway protein F/type IV pilus assembly protein PilC